jgi:hypothetical protein
MMLPYVIHGDGIYYIRVTYWNRMYEDYDTGFARHKGGVNESVAEYLWENQLIAIHWGDKPSADPADYDSGANEIQYLNEFAKEGRIVGVSYRSIITSEMLVGVVRSNSKVKLLYFDDGEFANEREVNPDHSIDDRNEAGYRIFKALELEDVKSVSREKYPVIFDNSVRPPSASIINWWNVEDHLRRIINGEQQERWVYSLRADEVEVLCEEFLRILNESYRTVRTVGGQVADVDISGVTENGRIWAEVTMGGRGDVEDKLKVLTDYTERNAEVLMFGPRDSKPDEISDHITYVPVEIIFDAVDLNRSGKIMINEMLNVAD